ncbi:armadillo-type protein, partial [Mycena capillaripes]
MQPLARQQSRASLLSWWSDSNPGLQGPTVNIHRMAKLLVRFLYHRQAMQFIRNNAGVPLTPMVLEIYSTYLLCKYVSFETQWTVLAELENRAREENEAAMIVESPVLAKVLQLLESPNPVLVEWTHRLVQNLAQYKATAAPILEITPLLQLVWLLNDKHPAVVEHAINALANAALQLDDAQAVIEAKVQHHVLELLESPDPVLVEWTHRLVQNLAQYKTTAAAILEITPFLQLVQLLDDKHPAVVEHAINALANAALQLDGAQAVFEAKVQHHVLELLESPNPGVWEWTCSDKHPAVVEHAIHALANVALRLDGAQAIIEAEVQHYVLELLESPNPEVRGSTCRLVGNLFLNKATAAAILEINSFVQLVLLFDDKHPAVVEHAINALAYAAMQLDGAQAVIEAQVQHHVLELLESPNPVVRGSTCRLVRNLFHNKATATALLAINPFLQLVLLLDDEHPDVVESALRAVANAAQWPDGAQAVVQATVQGHILNLLESPNPMVQKWTCWLVESLAYHEATTPTIQEIHPCPALASLLHNTDITVCKAAAHALEGISNWSDDVVAIADMGVAEVLQELNERSITDDIYTIQ